MVSVVCLQMRDALVQELQQKAEETELLHLELQMLETERVRLSLVEEKLMDVLQLLQQLRELVSQVESLGSESGGISDSSAHSCCWKCLPAHTIDGF